MSNDCMTRLPCLLLLLPLAALAEPIAPVVAETSPWTPDFQAVNTEDAAIARIAWEAAFECTGRVGKAHPKIAIHRRAIPGGFLGLAEWDDTGVHTIHLDPKPGRLEEVIVHEVAHAWVQEGPPALVEGRTELLADCIVNHRNGLASLQWDDGRTLRNLPDLRTWNNQEDHGPALLADARTDAYLGASRLLRAAAQLVAAEDLWDPELETWDDFRELVGEAEHGPRLLAAIDAGPEAQKTALDDADLDGLPRITEQIAGTDPASWDSDGDGWWDGEILGLPHMAVAVPFDGSPVCTGLLADGGSTPTAAVGGNVRGEGRLEVRVRQTVAGAPLVVELGGNPSSVTGGLWAAVEGTHLQRSTDCIDAAFGTIWAARPEFSPHIGDFAMALHDVATRAEARWGPTTRRMGLAIGADKTRMDGQVVELSQADVRQAIETGRLEELATLAVSLHRVWDNGTRQWPVATAMARSLEKPEDQPRP